MRWPKWPNATVALCWVLTPDAASWGPPLMYHVGDAMTPPTNRDEAADSRRCLAPAPQKNRRAAIPENVRSVPKPLEPTWQGCIAPADTHIPPRPPKYTPRCVALHSERVFTRRSPPLISCRDVTTVRTSAYRAASIRFSRAPALSRMRRNESAPRTAPLRGGGLAHQSLLRKIFAPREESRPRVVHPKMDCIAPRDTHHPARH